MIYRNCVRVIDWCFFVNSELIRKNHLMNLNQSLITLEQNILVSHIQFHYAMTNPLNLYPNKKCFIFCKVVAEFVG